MSNPPASPSSSPSPVVCAGMIVVDHLTPPIARLPKSGELIAVDGLVLNIGGGAANTAMALSRLSVPASICARVGDDAFGRFATETLQAAGVESSAVKIDGRRATSQTLILNVKGEDRRFIHSVGANLGFVPADMDEALATSPRVLHIGYFLILPELDADGLAERFARVRKAGGQTLLDVVTPGPGAYIEPLRKVLPHTDVFVPNTDEAALILGETDPLRQARIFHEMGARRVVVTRGEHGLVSYSGENRLQMGAYPVDFVDGSGGGDAFNAGYILGLLENRSEIDCLKLASAVGASCVRAVGTTAGVFSRPEAEEFLRRHPITLEPVDA
ncbi:MAG: carbohydrate kinase family protein [Paludisphaera borealis]|uniref:carbohydrate kinase family protein n=1 Tax=Paludisphaera borealis TaxID=1387353 RepID=UPI002846E586|nr:carbohydrate kinase family protein [Paludisphaera borealis]MDR3622242.1 carbohydrate kinase family protein [Paludisphaera borealis]